MVYKFHNMIVENAVSFLALKPAILIEASGFVF
jgi:hypothetical protein